MGRTKMKRMAVFFCVLFIAAALLTTFFIIEHADHECSGHDCPICAQIHTVESLVKQISTAVVGMGFTIGRFLTIFVCITGFLYLAKLFSLVRLKVRMNN